MLPLLCNYGDSCGITKFPITMSLTIADSDYVIPVTWKRQWTLHWLLVWWRIQFKLCVIMHCVHNGTAPAYLDNAVQPVNHRTVRPGLCSENSLNYYVPRVHIKLGERAFSYTGPVVWNNSLMDIRAEPAYQTLQVSRTFSKHIFLNSYLTH